MPTLEAIRFDPSTVSLQVLDQILIPFQEKYLTINSIADGYGVIKAMQVRGAPAIAIVGMLSIVVELYHITKTQALNQWFYDLHNLDNFKTTILARIDYLVSSRPTAVNLSNAATEVIELIKIGKSPLDIYERVSQFSIKLFKDDVLNNRIIGQHGAEYILNHLKSQNFAGPFSVLTICNTGSLATAGHGTALGVVRSLWELSKANSDNIKNEKKIKIDSNEYNEAWLEQVFPLETRPYNQGSRLTAFELVYEKIPSTLITDNMISFLLDSIANKRISQPPVKAIVVGADRIAANGDTANKIGTLQLATIAKSFGGILFLVVAPTTTIDKKCPHGREIIVEERPANELRMVKGGIKINDNEYQIANVQIAPSEIPVWNPSFDVTGHELIDGIVTENGVLEKQNGKFAI